MKFKLEIELELPEQVDGDMFRERVTRIMDAIEDGLSESHRGVSVDQFSETASIEIENLIIEQRKLVYEP